MEKIEAGEIRKLTFNNIYEYTEGDIQFPNRWFALTPFGNWYIDRIERQGKIVYTILNQFVLEDAIYSYNNRTSIGQYSSLEKAIEVANDLYVSMVRGCFDWQ